MAGQRIMQISQGTRRLFNVGHIPSALDNRY